MINYFINTSLLDFDCPLVAMLGSDVEMEKGVNKSQLLVIITQWII